MGKTIKVGPHFVDYGPHTFHIRETEESRAIHEAIKPFFGDDPLILTRGTRVLLRGKEYVYPLEMLQVLTGVSPLLSARIIFDYLMASAKSTFAPAKKEHSFEEWGVRNLGRTLVRLVLRHLLRARVGSADVADFVEAGAARREAQPEEHHPAHARHQGRSGHLLHEVHVSAEGHQRALREHGGPGAEARQLHPAAVAGGAARTRPFDRGRAGWPHPPRGLSEGRARGDDRVRRRAVDAAAAAPRRSHPTGAAASGGRSCREAPVSQPQADLHRAQAEAADRLSLGLSARRALPRQPDVRAEERQRRDGAGGSDGAVHRAVVLARRAASGKRPTRRSTGSRCAT